MLPCVIYMFVWSTLIYDPIACWTWNPHGWSNRLGTIDFAGGTPVHISSGTAALAYSYMLGKRRGHGTQELNFRPHNVTHIILGTVFLWVGWFGFNAGSALGANLRAVMAAVVTNLAACVGGMTWCMVDYRLERKWSAVGFCSGVVAGLVAITPGSGYVPAWAAVIYGIVAGTACNYATKLKYFLRCDDALDIFAVHAIGGLSGNILTAFFAADYIAHLDGFSHIPGGWLNHHWVQLGYQLADSFAGGAYSFFGTCLILAVLDFVGKWLPALKLRVSEDEEIVGVDDVEIGEFAVSDRHAGSSMQGSADTYPVRLRGGHPRSPVRRRSRSVPPRRGGDDVARLAPTVRAARRQQPILPRVVLRLRVCSQLSLSPRLSGHLIPTPSP